MGLSFSCSWHRSRWRRVAFAVKWNGLDAVGTRCRRLRSSFTGYSDKHSLSKSDRVRLLGPPSILAYCSSTLLLVCGYLIIGAVHIRDAKWRSAQLMLTFSTGERTCFPSRVTRCPARQAWHGGQLPGRHFHVQLLQQLISSVQNCPGKTQGRTNGLCFSI